MKEGSEKKFNEKSPKSKCTCRDSNLSLVALRGTKGSSKLHHGFGVPSVRENIFR